MTDTRRTTIRGNRRRIMRPLVALYLAGVLVAALLHAVAFPQAALAATNLVQNPSLENVDANGVPSCFEQSGWGTHTVTQAVSPNSHTGANAYAITISGYVSGDRKLMMSETTPGCAPAVTPGQTYDLSVWYESTSTAGAITAFTHTAAGWSYWTDIAPLPLSPNYSQAAVTTPVIPAGVDAITWGLSISGNGTLTTDDYSMVVHPAPVTTGNLTQNPSVENVDANGVPSCFEQSGWGTHTVTQGSSADAHTGTKAYAITMSGYVSGDRKLMMNETTPGCAPAVTPGQTYDLSVWYKSTAPQTSVTVFTHSAAGWSYWTDVAQLPAAQGYTQAAVTTPAIPAGVDKITWGVSLAANGTLTTDDYSTVAHSSCTAGAACTQGSWQVLSYPSPVRAIHAALLPNGNVLLIAGSGNDPTAFAAGTFSTSIWNPTTGAFTTVPTPADFFCAGHVLLPDGRLLVMGGNLAYPNASHGYEGLASSYIFDPTTASYVRVNDLNTGHWYPSATELGNGDIMSLGGLDQNGNGSVEVERFYNASLQWNNPRPTQTYRFWGLYPTMILMQDGRLFYSGAHVFGNNVSTGPGANLYNVDTGVVTDVPGLRQKDNKDQAMSLLLPPAQAQKVATFGGGNIVTNVDANNLVDEVDLSVANPAYTPGPNLPAAKMYVSAVILPDGKVFETGGGLHNRADPVYEASMFDPKAQTFTSMATDPVPRTYHSSAMLLPDGRVFAIGNNPGDGSFDLRMSVYTPSYLLKGPRPTITSGAAKWAYGSTQTIGTTSAAPIASAQLIKPAAVTHSSDPNQRSVDLPISTNAGGQLTVSLTANPNIAPPGDYMLFVTDANGVPSVARWVHVG